MDMLIVGDLDKNWQALVVDSGADSLATHAEALENAGYEIKFVTPNGVDRWTILARRPAERPPSDPRKRRWFPWR